MESFHSSLKHRTSIHIPIELRATCKASQPALGRNHRSSSEPETPLRIKKKRVNHSWILPLIWLLSLQRIKHHKIIYIWTAKAGADSLSNNVPNASVKGLNASVKGLLSPHYSPDSIETLFRDPTKIVNLPLEN